MRDCRRGNLGVIDPDYHPLHVIAYGRAPSVRGVSAILRGSVEIALRIWLSSAGAATTQVIRMLRDNPDAAAVRIYGTNVDPAAPALAACDVGGVEPRHVGNDAYAEFALDFCRRHRIDVLIPPRRLAALAGRADAFAEVGTKLMCSPAAAVDLLTSKSRTYEAARAVGIPVPAWRVVSDADAFRDAVDELGGAGDRICIKPAGEFSAFGFRILDDRPLRMRDLLAPPLPLASVSAVADALKLAADVQVRHWNGKPVLLEANPRASAGIFQTAFTGVNLPWVATRLLLRGDAGPLESPRLGGRVAVTETVTEVAVGP